jgi:hypothetical protein
MISTRKNQRGYAIIGLVMVFLIIAILSQNYFTVDPATGKPWAVSQIDRARGAAAAMNFRTAQTQWIMKSEGRTPEINRLRDEMAKLSTSMGSGGCYFVHQNQLMITTQMTPTKFSSQFPLPRIR